MWKVSESGDDSIFGSWLLLHGPQCVNWDVVVVDDIAIDVDPNIHGVSVSPPTVCVDFMGSISTRNRPRWAQRELA